MTESRIRIGGKWTGGKMPPRRILFFPTIISYIYSASSYGRTTLDSFFCAYLNKCVSVIHRLNDSARHQASPSKVGSTRKSIVKVHGYGRAHPPVGISGGKGAPRCPSLVFCCGASPASVEAGNNSWAHYTGIGTHRHPQTVALSSWRLAGKRRRAADHQNGLAHLAVQ